MDCKTCKELRAQPSVPYVAHEAEMARAERAHKRLWITILLLIVLLVGSNLGWIYYESQFETVESTSYEVDQDADNGTNNFAGGDMYGPSESKGN